MLSVCFQSPLLTHRLLIALSSESINFQLGQLVQTSQYSRADSTIPNNRATKRASKSKKAGNLAQEDLNYSGEPAIQNIHFGYTYIDSHKQTSYRRKWSGWHQDVGIQKKKFLNL